MTNILYFVSFWFMFHVFIRDASSEKLSKKQIYFAGFFAASISTVFLSESISGVANFSAWAAWLLLFWYFIKHLQHVAGIKKSNELNSAYVENIAKSRDASSIYKDDDNLDKNLSEKETIIGEALEFMYSDADGVMTDRKVLVNNVYEKNGCIYIDGYCYARKSERTFRSDRIIGGIKDYVGSIVVLDGYV